ncbi:MAG: DNA methyltransferase [Rhizomicrobium sp.]|jgi:hypothetical protein
MNVFGQLCDESGLTSDEISEALEVSRDVLENYRAGLTRPSVREIQVLRGFSVALRKKAEHHVSLAVSTNHSQDDLLTEAYPDRTNPPADVQATPSVKQRAGSSSTSGVARRKSANTQTFALPFLDDTQIAYPKNGTSCALEDSDFPFETLSDICEVESWRKEVSRPLTHIHKWWAQRLGTVFRAMVIGAMAPSGTNIIELFHKRARVKSDAVIFDPFMGSGTTLCEAVKLGARVIGRDINPVAHFLVKNALSIHDRTAILQTFSDIERDVSQEILKYYRAELSDGAVADVLYYFWVKQADCPKCARSVDLFANYVFAQNAYPRKQPQAQAICPSCGGVNATHFDARNVCCSSCELKFDPQVGPATGKKAKCAGCGEQFLIANAIREKQGPPRHRLYAKLVLTTRGEKIYLAATAQDHALYAAAKAELECQGDRVPHMAIKPGYNTDQALGYNYQYWHEMFNARQLLSISKLANRIARTPDPVLRELFTCLLTGALEFNNMFASYKGEGTGAVRHMFAHHVLKPERTPLEANLWGTPKSSGSFSTMFRTRISRALDYADNPFELRVIERQGKKSGAKVFGLSDKIGYEIADSYQGFEAGKRVYLSCGDSGRTDLADRSVDSILTDPPFFDNVHYSQLADFFYVWQRFILGNGSGRESLTTRSDSEVQNAEETIFTDRLTNVWNEANRVLKDDGILAFTYHHSRAEGWRAVLRALMNAGFVITAAHPIKSEMSVAMPKHQAKEPIDLDVILVCRKRSENMVARWDHCLIDKANGAAATQVQRFRSSGRRLSRNDVRVIVMAQLLRIISFLPSADEATRVLDAVESEIEGVIERLNRFNERDGLYETTTSIAQ